LTLAGGSIEDSFELFRFIAGLYSFLLDSAAGGSLSRFAMHPDHPLVRSPEVRDTVGGNAREFSDPKMVGRLADGEVEALRALYQHYGMLAYSLAVRILGDRVLRAEDVIQEAFMRVWSHADSFDATRGSLRSWLLTTVRNRAINCLRDRAGVEGQKLELSGELPIHGAGSDPWRDVPESLEGQTVREALANLPPDQRQVVELAYYGGYTQREIAAMVGIPLATVKVRTWMALEKLSSYFQGRAMIDVN
jgi:RNA polymerase sigma factor (sigma-70 family)